MSVFVKICGLTTAEALDAAVETGADAVGFVFAESPRKMSVAEAVALVRDLPDTVVRFAVMFHPTQAEWDEVAAGFAPDWIQTDAQDFSRLDIAPGKRSACLKHRQVVQVQRQTGILRGCWPEKPA
jgi:phosphoribosylanthranilate isomerase